RRMGNNAPHSASTISLITACEGNSRLPYSRLRPTVVRHCSRVARNSETMPGKSQLGADLLTTEESDTDLVMKETIKKDRSVCQVIPPNAKGRRKAPAFSKPVIIMIS